jgi:hypothetical protein
MKKYEIPLKNAEALLIAGGALLALTIVTVGLALAV